MKKFLVFLLSFAKTLLDLFLFAFGFDCDMRRKAVDEGLCDFSGQGRNKYGK